MAGRDVEAAPTVQSFHDAMSRVGGAVTIVTTAGPAGRAGFTATSFAPVSDDPPVVLACLNQTSRSAAILLANKAFAVNVLAAGPAMVTLANVFAGRTGLQGEARFGSGDWQTDETGLPVLPGALAVFSCRLTDVRDVATHHVLFGAVDRIRLGPDAPALIYRKRGYHTL